MNQNELIDRMAIRELVDRISMLGDQKDFERQMQLFSEDAVSETIAEGKTILRLTGSKEMAPAFARFLQDMETVYHFNGQQVVTLNGDKAKGTCYCFITLIGNENGRKINTTIGAIYEDDYIRTNDQWLVAKRVGRFEWQERSTEGGKRHLPGVANLSYLSGKGFTETVLGSGTKTYNAFLETGLVTDIHLNLIPVVIGDGGVISNKVNFTIRFKLTEHKPFNT